MKRDDQKPMCRACRKRRWVSELAALDGAIRLMSEGCGRLGVLSVPERKRLAPDQQTKRKILNPKRTNEVIEKIRKLFDIDPSSRWDLAFRWIISLAYPVIFATIALDLTEAWWGWARIVTAISAAVVAFWLFEEVIPVRDDEPVGLSDEDDDTTAVPVA